MSARARLALLLLVGALGGPGAAHGLVLADGDPERVAGAPAVDFGFERVGDRDQSAVYLGKGWVLTASHVPLGPLVLQGVSYEPVADSKQRMYNDAVRPMPDLALFRLQDAPDLPLLPIRPVPPRVGDLVYLAGNGPGRGPAVEFAGVPGWAWNGEPALRWGTNRVHAVDLTVTVGFGNETTAFATQFGTGPSTDHEAQVSVGDSGGGAFIERDGRFELAGILFAANQHDEQTPGTAIRGNLTYIVDLSVYRDQILRAIECEDDPECAGPPEVANERVASPESCAGSCGDGFAWSFVALLAVRRRWPSGARRHRHPRAPS